MIDAAVILFREGLESLLILGKAKAAWWYVLVGGAIAVVLGLALSFMASQVIIVRGVASLAAAALIFYMLIEAEESHRFVLVAVVREGLEAALFFTAIPPQDILPGALLGASGVLVVGVLIYRFGLQSARFLAAATAFLFFLCVKLVGVGIYDLQLGGVIQATALNLPTIKDLGFYPTVETLGVQLATILIMALAWRFRQVIQ